MNWLNDFVQQIRWSVENFVWDIQDKIQMWKLDRELSKNCVPFVGEYNDEELDQANGISGTWEDEDEEVEVKPKKKKSKKKSVKKVKKSV